MIRNHPPLSAVPLAITVWIYLHPVGTGAAGLAVLIFALIAGTLLRDQVTVGLFPLLLTTAVIRCIGGWPASWPLQFLIPVLITLAAGLFLPPMRDVRAGLEAGEVSPLLFRWSIIIGLLSVLVLHGWNSWLNTGRSGDRVFRFETSFPLVLVSALGFSLINAAVEELYFRGILQGILEREWTSYHSAVFVQAIFFGALHFQPPSVPFGVSGVILTTILAFALGYLKILGKGLAAPILAHTVADMGVYLMLAG